MEPLAAVGRSAEAVGREARVIGDALLGLMGKLLSGGSMSGLQGPLGIAQLASCGAGSPLRRRPQPPPEPSPRKHSPKPDPRSSPITLALATTTAAPRTAASPAGMPPGSRASRGVAAAQAAPPACACRCLRGAGGL
eukprot:6144052-Prymnesium_polylepis.1